MSRPFAATVMGIAFVIVYVAAAITLPDVLPANWVVHAVYFLVAGWCGCCPSGGSCSGASANAEPCPKVSYAGRLTRISLRSGAYGRSGLSAPVLATRANRVVLATLNRVKGEGGFTGPSSFCHCGATAEPYSAAIRSGRDSA